MNVNKNFALIGAAGYIAPRHLQAIRETDNSLLAILDKSDSVGIIDTYFPEAFYFSEFERFDRHISKWIHVENGRLDYVSICTPNYLHDAHIRFALRNGADAICEKPLVLNPWNIEALKKQETYYQQKVFTILQLRLHPSIQALKKKIEESSTSQKFEVDLTYITSRGRWYLNSWKGNVEKSGGLASNIGVHFFDMLSWIFGPIQDNQVYCKDADTQSGFLEFEKAKVRWFLSVNEKWIPQSQQELNKRTYRSMQIDGEEIEFSDGFQDLHTKSYEQILEGKGFGLDEAKASVEIIHDIRNAEILPTSSSFAHPFLAKI